MLSPDQMLQRSLIAERRRNPAAAAPAGNEYGGGQPPRVGHPDATDLLLNCHLCPGDTVVMTGAVRDLHRAYPGRFRTAVDTDAIELWNHNPHIVRATELDPAKRAVIHWGWGTALTNERPRHLLQVWADELADRIGVPRYPITEFRGDIHLDKGETDLPPRAVVGTDEPYWVIMAGGKRDCRVKIWPEQNWQPVVDHFRGRIQFVQCGVRDMLSTHATLSGVIDLVGKTTLRQFLQVIYFSSGVLCPITFAMHLSAAVPFARGDNPLASDQFAAGGGFAHWPDPRARRLRPCVVIASGREPHHLIQYPGHRVLHRIGSLPCTAYGSCWKDFVGEDRIEVGPNTFVLQHPHQKCLHPRGQYARCMTEIRPAEVIAAIEGCLQG